jgi:hypothetical protein
MLKEGEYMTTIDARHINGEFVFRLWSRIAGGYATTDMNEEDLRRAVRVGYLQGAYSTYQREIEQRITRAKECGTSEYGEPPGINAEWREDMLDNGEDDKEEADEEPNLDGMDFLVGGYPIHTSQLDARTLKEANIFMGDEWDTFVRWAELSTFGEVFKLNSIYVVRILPNGGKL